LINTTPDFGMILARVAQMRADAVA